MGRLTDGCAVRSVDRSGTAEQRPSVVLVSAFIGRDQEIRTLTGLLRGGATAGQAIMLIGEPGIGKSALLSVAADAARGAGYEVLTATGRT